MIRVANDQQQEHIRKDFKKFDRLTVSNDLP